jgi:hypothetical protein
MEDGGGDAGFSDARLLENIPEIQAENNARP